ncbi:cadherin repeat domain-containing protein [Flagellimonas sp.]|uniref:cadherin repeat domain-containing protein n=1 Tax=Flagellimonas sp. TaxID=2058762 RepID=UPI003F49EC53
MNITIEENPAANETLGQIPATTNSNPLTYSIVSQNPEGAFSINPENGEITVLDALLFDFESSPKINGTVRLANSEVSKEVTVTITLTDVEIEIFTGNVRLKSQEEVDSFGKYNFQEIHGYLHIDDSADYEFNLTNLDALNSITSITAYLSIRRGNKLLNNLAGLRNINTVGKHLLISNDLIRNLNALEKIEIIGGDLSISGNELININGLKNLNYLGGDLRLLDLPNLSDSSLFPRFTEINGALFLQALEGPAIYDIFSQLARIKSYLYIKDTDLTDLNVFENLNFVSQGIYLSRNEKLTNLNGFSKLTHFGGLELSYNPVLENIDALPNLENLGFLLLEGNANLQNIKGLGNVTAIDAILYMGDTVFENLDALTNLKSVGGSIVIEGNSKLKNLDGLSNLETIVGITPGSEYADYHFSIYDNPMLNDLCGLTKLFEDFPYRYYRIEENAYNPTVDELKEGICEE